MKHAALIALAITAPALAQLTPPPGAVANTDRVREQADARTPISQAGTIITASGSYYLTGNLSTFGGAALEIQASDVTIDLNGFAITNSSVGIVVTGVRSNIKIHNGSFNTCFGSAIDAENANGAVIEDIRIERAGRGTQIAPLTEPAVIVGRNSRVERVTAIDVGEGIGIANEGIVRDCIISNSGGDGISTTGVQHLIERCVITETAGIGIDASIANVVRDCSIDRTSTFGIRIGAGSLVERCAIDEAGSTAIFAGPRVSIRDCSIINSSATALQAAAFAEIVGVSIDSANTGITTLDDATIDRCTISNIVFTAVRVADSGLITNCRIESPGQIGIDAGNFSRIVGNLVRNPGQYAIQIGDDTTVDGNSLTGLIGGSAQAIFNQGIANTIVRNDISLLGDLSGLGGSTSWLFGNSGGSVIGGQNDLTSPWTNFID